MTWRNATRILLFFTTTVACIIVAIVPYTNIYEYSESDKESSKELLLVTEMLKEAHKRRLDLSTSLVSPCLLLLAAVWGLVISDKASRRVELRHFPELMGIVAVSLMIAFSLLNHFRYVDNSTAEIAYASQLKEDKKIANFVYSESNKFLKTQMLAMFLASIGSALLFVSMMLSGDAENERSNAQASNSVSLELSTISCPVVFTVSPKT